MTTILKPLSTIGILEELLHHTVENCNIAIMSSEVTKDPVTFQTALEQERFAKVKLVTVVERGGEKTIVIVGDFPEKDLTEIEELDDTVAVR